MSYCTFPRLTFSGQFQADVSTVNNDVRHYQNDTFEPWFQDPQDGTALNGWWNPEGTGAFRLLGVQVKGAQVAIGDDPGADRAACGLFLNGQSDRPAAKLVDLDPQSQGVSSIFGLSVVLTDGATEFLRGTFRWAAFRDLYGGRKQGAKGIASPSAKFTSILTEVTFTPSADESPVLRALRDSARRHGDRLSINLMTAGFNGGTTLGALTGSIGPYQDGDPETFLAGRRFVVADGDVHTASGIGFFDAEIAGGVLSMDLSNALPLAPDLKPTPPPGVEPDPGPGAVPRPEGIGPLLAAVLHAPDTVTRSGAHAPTVTAGVPQGATVRADQLTVLGEIPYQQEGWLQKTAGLVDYALDDAAARLVVDHPLALVQPRTDRPEEYHVLIRETVGGLWARADQFVFRMDPRRDRAAVSRARVRVTQWGRPVAGWVVDFRLQDKQSGIGGGDPKDPDLRNVGIPDINVPPGKIAYTPAVRSGQDGWAVNVIKAADPGNPRTYLDGQIYNIDYWLRLHLTGDTVLPMETIVLHVRDSYDPPVEPDWESDIAPFMQQYSNLYPVMSKGLFSLADAVIAEKRATLLELAFTRDINDPNHMPVTRDLSEGKRVAVLRFLCQYTKSAPPPYPPVTAPQDQAPTAPAPGALDEEAPVGRGPVPVASAEVIERMLAEVGDGFDGKTHALRDQLRARLHQAKGSDS